LRWLRNRLKLRDKHLDYVWMALPSAPHALPEARSWLRTRLRGRAPTSLWDIDKLLRRIADDPRPKGVILRIGEPMLSLADLQTLRNSILRFRARGRHVIAYGQSYGLAAYFLASACDEIILQPGGELDTLGLRQRATFLKNALDSIGVSLDVVAITPFKGALDPLSRETISEEGRAQIDWLLDSRYAILVDAIAEGRKMTPDAAREMIDRAPHLDEAAKAAGYVDAVLHEHEVAGHLGVEHIVTQARAEKMLIQKARRVSPRGIAVLPVSGLMVPGESAKPPVDLPIPFIGGETMGDRTVVQSVRQLMGAEGVAAVVLWIDSGGGSAVAAEAMTAALVELAKSKPLVVFMNGVAASGGYYIATAGRWIVAQPGTITGSIGVVLAKPITRGLWQRLKINTIEFQRGANADLLDDGQPFSPAQREQMRASVEHVYTQFITRVAKARGTTLEAVDAVGGGRVWTGAQALDHKLVDELGDLHAALAKARQFADLPDDAPVYLWRGKGDPLPPLRAKAAAFFALFDILPGAIYGRHGATHGSPPTLRAIANGKPQMLVDVWWER
jgi:protease-4